MTIRKLQLFMIPYLIYLLIILFLSYKGAKNKIYRLIQFVLAVLFLGLRDGVGTDFEEYKERYDYEIYSFELGYNYLCILLHHFRCSSTYIFLSMSFLTYLPFYMFLEKLKCKRKYFILMSFFLYFSTFPIICNVMRECLVAALFFYSYYFIKERKLILYLLLIAIGVTFHTSMILCLPLYWIVNRRIPVLAYTLVYLISFIFCFVSIDRISAYILPFIDEFNQWARYLDSEHSLSGYFSIGILVDIVFNIIFYILCIKNKIQKEHPIAFNLFFLSCIFFNMKVGSIIMGRIWMLFKWYIFIVLLFLLQSKKESVTMKITRKLYITYLLLAFIQYALSEASSMYPYKSVLDF